MFLKLGITGLVEEKEVIIEHDLQIEKPFKIKEEKHGILNRSSCPVRIFILFSFIHKIHIITNKISTEIL